MKISHCIASIDLNSGGTTTACLDLVNELSKEVITNLFSLKTDNQSNLVSESVGLYTCEHTFLDYSKSLNKAFFKVKSDLFHGHGLWNFPLHQMVKFCLCKNIPYIISVHGMLEPWSLRQSKIKKKLAMSLYQHKDLIRASCLHATAESEAENIRRLGYKNPIAIIPNGIDVNEYPLKKSVKSNGKRKILFLSRIHPKKGIEILIDAWEAINISLRRDWEIEIAGNGESEYIESLEQKILSSSLQDEIKIIGPKFGLDKIKCYHSADLFVLPTYSENFGIVIAEALSCGLPVITTKGTPWDDLIRVDAGSWIDIGVESLKNTLENYLVKKQDDLKHMGENGRRLIEEKYSIESVGNNFLKLYKWLLYNTEKPDFVV